MIFTLNGVEVPLLPRVEAMVRLLVEHQGEIEHQASGRVALDFAPWQVALSITTKRGLKKIDRPMGSGNRPGGPS